MHSFPTWSLLRRANLIRSTSCQAIRGPQRRQGEELRSPREPPDFIELSTTNTVHIQRAQPEETEREKMTLHRSRLHESMSEHRNLLRSDEKSLTERKRVSVSRNPNTIVKHLSTIDQSQLFTIHQVSVSIGPLNIRYLKKHNFQRNDNSNGSSHLRSLSTLLFSFTSHLIMIQQSHLYKSLNDPHSLSSPYGIPDPPDMVLWL